MGLDRDALEGKGPRKCPRRQFDGRLEELAKAAGSGYCRLRTPLKLALAVKETVAGHRLGKLEWGGGGGTPPFQCIPGARGWRLAALAVACLKGAGGLGRTQAKRAGRARPAPHMHVVA